MVILGGLVFLMSEVPLNRMDREGALIPRQLTNENFVFGSIYRSSSLMQVQYANLRHLKPLPCVIMFQSFYQTL